ncbi:MAG: methyltransferase [Planctomycetota bacterium]|nr:methyltransferase [Planctomycetota bacterium]
MSAADDDLARLLAMDLHVGEDDWQPTPHGRFLVAVLARYNLVAEKDVLELGAGAANQTIVMVRQGARRVVATEIDEAALATTRANVERNCPGSDVVEYRVADWLATEGDFDVVVTNPPFAKSGKRNRRYFIDSLILDAHKRLRPGGDLVFIQSSMADIAKTLRRLAENGYHAGVLAETSGPFRDYYFEDEAFMAEIQHVPDGFQIVDGTYMEKLFVVRARLSG